MPSGNKTTLEVGENDHEGVPWIFATPTDCRFQYHGSISLLEQMTIHRYAKASASQIMSLSIIG
jgi:hypothetical protein